MKLIICASCQDIFKLQDVEKRCVCGKSWGLYLDNGLKAKIGGDAIPLGIDNSSLADALANRKEKGKGIRFTSFVISDSIKNIEQVGERPRIIKRYSAEHVARLLMNEKI
ncbi:MAG: hypothetical protein QM500_04965 [Methylococcales bacterium]